MTRVLWINPVGFDAYDVSIGEELRREANPDTRIDVCSLPGGVGSLPPGTAPQHLEWNALEAVVAGPTVGVIRWARQQGYDATVIGCFYDPFLRAAREVAGPMAVTAPAEACLHIASTVGERISVLVGRTKWIPEMDENVVKHGFSDRVASFRLLGMGVDEFQRDPPATEQRIIDEAAAAVDHDRAVIVLGCTIEFGFYREMQEKIGAPVIDAITAPILYAEFSPPCGATAGRRARPAATTRPQARADMDRRRRARPAPRPARLMSCSADDRHPRSRPWSG